MTGCSVVDACAAQQRVRHHAPGHTISDGLAVGVRGECMPQLPLRPVGCAGLRTWRERSLHSAEPAPGQLHSCGRSGAKRSPAHSAGLVHGPMPSYVMQPQVGLTRANSATVPAKGCRPNVMVLAVHYGLSTTLEAKSHHSSSHTPSGFEPLPSRLGHGLAVRLWGRLNSPMYAIPVRPLTASRPCVHSKRRRTICQS